MSENLQKLGQLNHDASDSEKTKFFREMKQRLPEGTSGLIDSWHQWKSDGLGSTTANGGYWPKLRELSQEQKLAFEVGAACAELWSSAYETAAKSWNQYVDEIATRKQTI